MEVKFENVSYIYNDKTQIKKEALNSINLKFQEGKITSLVGKSGSGKSTIAELLNALRYPTDGFIQIGSYLVDSKGLKTKKKINDLRINVGLVFQFPEEQFFNLTVKDEVGFGMKYFKYKVSEIDKRVVDALKMMGLDESYLSRSPFTLSNGEKRKVAIASILVFNPKIIVLDEPTVGLDSLSKKNLLQVIRKLKMRYNKTIVLISHDIEMVHKITDYIYVINDGSIVLEGDKYKVFKEKRLLEKCDLCIPKIMEFSNLVLEKKGIRLGYRDDINDLIKDIYRHVK